MMNPLQIAPIRALHDCEKKTQLMDPTSLPIRQPISRIVGPSIAIDAPKQRNPQHRTKLLRTLNVQHDSRSSKSDKSATFLSVELFSLSSNFAAVPCAGPACVVSELLTSFMSLSSNISSSFGEDVFTSRTSLLFLFVSALAIVDDRTGIFGVVAAECGLDLNGEGWSIFAVYCFILSIIIVVIDICSCKPPNNLLSMILFGLMKV